MQFSRAFFLLISSTIYQRASRILVRSSISSLALVYSSQRRRDSRSMGLSFHVRRCCSPSGQLVLSRVEEEVVMPRVRALINDWRSRSRELRYAAVKTADVKAKASMMGAADGYDKLAQQTASENERRSGKAPSQEAMQR